jgi:hypothetical protein
VISWFQRLLFECNLYRYNAVLTGLGVKRALCVLTLNMTQMSSSSSGGGAGGGGGGGAPVLSSVKIRPFTSDADVFVNGRRLESSPAPGGGGGGGGGAGLGGVNGEDAAEKTLKHGDRVVVGANHVFRYHDPAYAATAAQLAASAGRAAVAREPADWLAAQEELRRAAVAAMLKGAAGLCTS